MSEQQPKLIQSPLTRGEIQQIAAVRGGTIDAIVAVSLNEIIECRDSEEFDDLLEERICTENCEISLRYDPNYECKLFGIDKIEQQILIHIQSNINQWLGDFEEE